MKDKMFAIGVIIVLIGAVLVAEMLPRRQSVTEDKLQKFASYEELKNFISTSTNEAAYYRTFGGVQTLGAMEQTAAKGATTPETQQTVADYSKTNVQVEGIDEADIVKNDGKYIYAVSGNKVMIIDAYPAANAKILSSIEFNTTPEEIFINGDRLVVFGQEYNYGYTEPALIKEGMARMPYYYESPSSFIRIYDISDRESPALMTNLSADGSYFDSRMIGNYVYGIVTQPVYSYTGEIPLPVVRPMQADAFPDIYYFDVPYNSYTFVNIIAVNVQTGEMTNKVYTIPSAQSMYVSANNIYITYTKWLDYADYMDRIIDEIILPVVPSDVANQISEARSVNEDKYKKFSRVEEIFNNYVEGLNPEERTTLMKGMQERTANLEKEIAKEREKTIIHKISIRDGEINYEVQGSVPGIVLNQFSMDENNGYFRIATTISASGGFGGIMPMTTEVLGTQEGISSDSSAGSTAEGVAAPEAAVIRPIVPPVPSQPTTTSNLYVLDGGMNIIGKVEDLAPGERIYSSRFMGDRAYMVTFRQVDPLFVIDLSNPLSPAVLGFLKVTGVSDYLHPVDETHLIGIGKEATEEGRFQGLKMSLFDVSDVANPKEISKIIIGDRGTDSEVLNDHKAFLFDKEKRLLVLPVLLAEIDRSKYPDPQWAYGEYKMQGAYVFDFSIENGFSLRGTVTHATNDTQDYQAYYGQYAVKRTLYIGNVLYTLSNKMVKMNNLDDLSEINKIDLPGYEEQIYRIL